MTPRLKLLSLSLLLASLATSLRADLTTGLVSYWPMDSTDGITAPDLSLGNTMSVVGPVAVSSGQFSNAFTLNGTSTYLTNLHTFDNGPTGLPIFRGRSYSISLWVKGAAQTAKYLYSEASVVNNNPIFIIQTGNAAAANSKLDIILRTDGNVTLVNHIVSTNVVFNNAWHHIAFVDDRGAAKLYVDGNLDAANFSYDGTFTDFSMNTTAIGTLIRAAIATANIFNGQIDEVATWERALSQDEVNQVRTNGVYTQGLVIPSRAASLNRVPGNIVKRVGDWHLFEVDAAGNRPLSYQWIKNGNPILDATNRTYQVLNLQTNNSGDFYSVAVTNAFNISPTFSTNSTVTVPPDAAPSLTNGLVNYWPLDVFNADTNSPEMHFGHNLVMKGMDTNSQIVAGQYSNAVFFLASLPTYGFRTNGTPIYNRTNYSLALWVKGNGVGQADRRVFSEGSTLENNSLISFGVDPIAAGSTLFRPFFRNLAGASASANFRLSTRPVFDDNWHHVVWTDANGKGKLYVDGTLDETDFTYLRTNLNLNLTMVGATARAVPVTPFTGIIDEVGTWDRILSWTEIQSIITNGIPIPTGIAAPTISTQPVERTNNVFVGDDVAFSVVVNGTFPVDYQWRKNGSPISAAVNPSAITDTLVLTNLQTADSNTTYFIVVTNAAGSVTSSVVRLYVTPWTPATNGEVLKVDFGLINSPNAQPGFAEFTLAANPASFNNGVRLTMTGVGAPLADRNRTAGAMVLNVPPFMTQAQIYNDFVFANNSTTDGTGLNLLIERLGTNVPYGVTIWSFDAQSGGTRFSDWTEMASGTPLPITNSWIIAGTPVTITNDFTYIFDGTIQPTNDYGQTLGGLFTSSAEGKLQIQALRHGGTSFGTFINAIRLVARPSATQITSAQLINGNIRLTIQGEFPGQPISILQNTDLVGGAWVPATGGTILEIRGPIVIAEFPAGANRLFYRAVTIAP